MQEIHSGTTSERILRNAVFAALVIIFASWYIWDGHIGYSRSNTKALVRSFGLDLEQTPQFDPDLTTDVASRLLQEVGIGAPADAVTSRLGNPNLEHKGTVYYFGPAGCLVIRLERGHVQEATWTPAPHSESDLWWQLCIGYAMALIGLGSLIDLLRVMTTKVSLTHAGMKVRGKALVPFEAMTALRTGKYKDAIVVEYSIAGRKHVIKLDSYALKEFPAIVSGICERTGFPHPGE